MQSPPLPAPAALKSSGQTRVSEPRAAVPTEQYIRQLDITTQTQRLLDHRVSQAETFQRNLSDAMRERDGRLSQQIELLQLQLQTVLDDSSARKKELSQLHEALASQGELIRQLLDVQRQQNKEQQ